MCSSAMARRGSAWRKRSEPMPYRARVRASAPDIARLREREAHRDLAHLAGCVGILAPRRQIGGDGERALHHVAIAEGGEGTRGAQHALERAPPPRAE